MGKFPKISIPTITISNWRLNPMDILGVWFDVVVYLPKKEIENI